jgi:hypothetical protein
MLAKCAPINSNNIITHLKYSHQPCSTGKFKIPYFWTERHSVCTSYSTSHAPLHNCAVQDSFLLNPHELDFINYCKSGTGAVTVLHNSIILQKQTRCRGDLLISSTPSQPCKFLPPLVQLHPLSNFPSIFSIDTDMDEHPAGYAMTYILSTSDSGTSFWTSTDSIMQDIQNENVL